MTQRTRKLVGAVLLVTLLIVYSLLAMTIGAVHFNGASILVQTLYYLVAGLAWLIPAGLLVRWMQRQDGTAE